MFTLTSGCCFFVLSVIGQQGYGDYAATRVAVVNLTEVFERYQMTRDLEQKFEERRQSVSSEAQQLRDDITMKRNALMDLKPGTPDFLQREEDLIRAEVSFQAWLEIQERRLKEQHKAWLELIYGHARDVVRKIATERKIDLVLTANDFQDDTPDSMAFKQQILLRSVIYADNRINLTEPVIEMLDTQYQKNGGAAMLRLVPNAPPAKGP